MIRSPGDDHGIGSQGCSELVYYVLGDSSTVEMGLKVRKENNSLGIDLPSLQVVILTCSLLRWCFRQGTPEAWRK